MRTLPLLLVAAMLLALVPFGAAAPPDVDEVTFEYDGQGGPLQLLHADGSVNTGTVNFTVKVSGGDASAVEVILEPTCTAALCDEVRVPLSDEGGGNWNGTLDFQDPELLAVDYAVRARATGSGGVGEADSNTDLEVEAAQDTGAPLLRVVGAQSGTLQLASGQSVALEVVDPLLARVLFDAPGRPFTTEITHPYVLSASMFQEGDTEATFTATDRALQTTTATVTVHKDTQAPVIEAVLPDDLYRAVDFQVAVGVVESSQHNVTVLFQDGRDHSSMAAGTVLHTFELHSDAVGLHDVHVSVVDALGNQASVTLTGDFSQPFADIALADPATTPEYPLAGDDVDIAVDLSQETGVKAQEVDTRFTLGSQTVTVTETVDVAATVPVVITRELGPGTHSVSVVANMIDLDANETDDGNQAVNRTFEVYIGKVVHGDDEYYIRVGDNGLPKEAIDTRGRNYTITLEDAGTQIVWAFEAQGDELHWDPTERTTTLKEDTPPETKDDPFPAVLLVVGALAALAARRRRS